MPGSGKSTWACANALPTLSTDALRHLLADDATAQSYNGVIFRSLHYLLLQRVYLRRPVTCIDATNLTRDDRKQWLRFAREYRCEIEAVFFDVPIEVCQERNRGRDRVVPPEVIAMMAAKMQPPAVEEGFVRVRVVS